MKQFAIFDLDGTVIDSMWAWNNVCVTFLKQYDIEISEAEAKKFNALSLKAVAEIVKYDYQIPLSTQEIIDDFCAIVSYSYNNTIGLKCDIAEYLEYLHKNNVKMCIATACTQGLTQDVLKRLKIDQYFEFILTCEELTTNKLSPLIYLTAAQRLGATIENAIVYEDSLHAVTTAKEAGFEVIAIHDEWENGNHHLIKEQADKFIMQYSEIIV